MWVLIILGLVFFAVLSRLEDILLFLRVMFRKDAHVAPPTENIWDGIGPLMLSMAKWLFFYPLIVVVPLAAVLTLLGVKP
jgi:hypothetical protein